MLRIVCPLVVLLATISGCSDQPLENVDSRSPAGEQAAASNQDVPGMDKQPAADPVASESEDAGADESEKAAESETPEQAQLRTTVSQLLVGMASDAMIERGAARTKLDELGQKGIPFVVSGLVDGDVTQKTGAAKYLIGRVSPRDIAAAQALVVALDAEDDTLRHAALQAVEKLSGEQLANAVPSLLRTAQTSSEAEVYRIRALRAIAKLGEQDEVTVTGVQELATSCPSNKIRVASYYTLSKIAKRSVAEEFYCVQLNSAESSDLRRLAAKWLAGVAVSEQSLSALAAAFEDADEEVRFQAVDSLVEIGKPALATLIQALRSPDVQTRRHGVLAVGKIGLLAKDAVPALKTCLDDSDEQVRQLAATVLKTLE